jgi:hypothetical protein
VTKKKTSKASRRRKSGSRTAKARRSTRSGRSRPASAKASRPKRSPAAAAWSLSRDRKLDLLGLLLIGLGLFSLASMLSPRPGLISGAWLDILRRGFGWGSYAIPVAFLAGGSWLMLRTLGERLPRLDVEQAVGLALLYLALLVILHALLGPEDFAAGLALAHEGRGGGVIGAGLLAGLRGGLGIAGAVVVLAGWVLVGLSFTARLSVPELFALTQPGWRWLRGRMGALRPTSSVSTDRREGPREAAPDADRGLHDGPCRRSPAPHRTRCAPGSAPPSPH